MTKIIGIAGKGGTGKTTFAALLIKELSKKGTVLAVDADANYNLNELLGVKVESTVGYTRDKVLENPPEGLSKQDFMKLELDKSLVESEGFDLLVMGRPEGPGCYCYPNTLIREYISILQKNYDYVVIDNEAGLEHLSRKTTSKLDIVFILSGPGKRDLLTAQRIKDLIKEMKIEVGEIKIILNRLDDDLLIDSLKIDGVIPTDKKIMALERNGESFENLNGKTPAFDAIKEILAKSNL